MKSLFATVILPVPVDRMFTYRIPDEMQKDAEPGKRVIVQFGAKKFYTAVIYELISTVPEGMEPKSVEMILDDLPVLSLQHLRFWKWMSDYYLCGPGDVMKTALPSGLRIESETKIQIHPGLTSEKLSLLSHHEQIIAAALQNSVCLSVTEIQRILEIKHVQHFIRNLISLGVAVSYEEYAEKYIPKKESYLTLAPEYIEDEEKLLQLSNNLSKKAPKQSDALVHFLHETTVRQSLHELPKKALMERSSLQAVRSLINKGIFIEHERIVSRFVPGDFAQSEFTLSNAQETALQSIIEGFREKNVQVLHGITSSGKTEIYIRLIEKELQEGRQVLYLLPEIALTQQIIKRLQGIFGSRIGVYHHRFNYHEKVELWNSVISPSEEDPKFQIIIGTRSALFLPFTNLGLIIIDEEHDSSYKQTDSSPRYNARDAAIVLSGILSANVLLGTATPSIETYYNVSQKKYGLTELNSRFRDMPLPHVKIVDMKKENTKGADWYISSELKKAISEALEGKRQVILFQNRRGFVPVLQCTQCGWIPGCSNCDITLTYHKKLNQLKCHLCGHAGELFSRCPECGSTHIKYVGFGTEKVEEEIRALFQGAGVSRMDTDTTRGKYAHQQIIQAFEDGETDILVGTQMVSKGLDFDRVSLVGILNADNLYHFPDFRSFERGFQMLTQIIGRAGRHNHNGTVILQTRKPEHRVITSAVSGDFLSFFNEQLKERHLYRYPPFYRLIQLSVQHKVLQKAQKFSETLKQRLKVIQGLILLGPEEPVYGRIKQYYIRNILIKIPRDQKHSASRLQIREIVTEFLNEKHHSGVRIIADADPN